MGLLDQIKKDIEQITSNKNEWADTITFISPTAQTAVISGIRSKIHLAVDTDGNMVRSQKAHIAFSEKFLTDLNYPVRNAAGEVALNGHKVNVKDSTGIVKNYVVQNVFPDETVGLLSFTLEGYGA